MSLAALIAWWSCSAFIPTVAAQLASELRPRPLPAELALIKTQFITRGSNAFNIGGLIGTLACIPIASLGRRNLYRIYFTLSAAALLVTFVPDWPATTRLNLMATLGLTVFGVFGSFPFYLPELFPMRLRGTGGGFTYNFGRIITAPFPFAVGALVRGGSDPLRVMSWLAVVPAIGALLAFAGAPVETRDEPAPQT
jgi:sugar phosphate permease